MKRPRRPCLSLLCLCAALTGTAAVTPTEWTHRQPLAVPVPGLVKVALPATTFDTAQPGLADLRLIDANGTETAYLLTGDPGEGLPPLRRMRPISFQSSTGPEGTRLLIETDSNVKLESIDLESSAPFFLKAAHTEVSLNGQDWESLGPPLPLFRQFGAEQLRLPLGGRRAAFVRITLDNSRSRPVSFSGAHLQPVPARPAPPPLVPVGAVVTRRDEFAGETVLTVTLDGAHVPLAELGLDAKDALFMRRVTIAIREVRGDVPGERTVGSGTIYRVALEGAPAQAQLAVPLEFSPPTRELLVHIHNGDSPPLVLDSVSARQHPVNLIFLAPAAGNYALLSGNAQVTAPRYDLAAFADEMRTAAATAVVPGALEPTPNYHARESLSAAPLPDVPLAGAPLDTKEWSYRKPVQLARAGVQELELDPEALARARPDFADLRLLRAGNQIPYVLERPALARSLSLQPAAMPDPKRPTVSRWQLNLPQGGMPVERLVLSSATPLFSREFRVYEKVTGADGRAHESNLASGSWSRTPEPGVPETRVFELNGRPTTGTLWLETDNGDNPAIALGAVQTTYPVVRLVFKVAETDGYLLAYGNAAAVAPRYDLSLVAVKLLTASRSPASIAPGEENPAARKSLFSLDRRFLLWGSLALVVVVLLAVVAKLLPKPPAA